jgi:hypothetical protein
MRNTMQKWRLAEDESFNRGKEQEFAANQSLLQ